jgi:tetratricopeptide (TPR) repeat protein
MRLCACAVVLLAAAAQAQYVGSQACAPCHPSQYQSFSRSPMGRSLQAARTPEFSKPARFVHSKTGRRYRIFLDRGERLIEESFQDQKGRTVYSDTRRVRYMIGSGNHARSFLIEQSGRLFQAPVTYFTQGGRWDMSPGYDTPDHVGFTRRVTANCLFCHAGRVNALSRAGDVFQTSRTFAETAIGCERCHGPAQQHIGRPGRAIVNPAKLSPELRDQVCEQCHLFGAARVLQPGRSLTDYRAGERLDAILAVYAWDAAAKNTPSVTGHPDEMKQSVCWQKSRNRLWCGSCHAIHDSNSRASYRAKCLSCHARNHCSRPTDSSKVGQREDDCVACHMPKRPVIESAHVAFTDHRIQRRPNSEIAPRVAGVKLRPVPPAGLDDPVVASRNLGFAYAEVASSTGRHEFFPRVVELLDPLIGTDVTDAPFWQTLGEAYLATGGYARAEEAFRKAVALDQGSASAQYTLGYLLQLRNRLPEAIEAYRRAVEADPYKAEAFANLAAAYLKMGEQRKALEALKSALRLEPGNLRWRAMQPALVD